MKNVKELRDELIDVFELLKDKKITAKDAKELVNCAGKIILSSKTQLDYNKHMNYKSRIGFLEVDSEDVEPTNQIYKLKTILMRDFAIKNITAIILLLVVLLANLGYLCGFWDYKDYWVIVIVSIIDLIIVLINFLRYKK